MDTVDPPGAVHVFEQLAILLRLGFGGVDDILRLLKRPARMPVALAAVSAARPRKGRATCPPFLPRPLLFCCRRLAAAFSSGSSAHLMATASDNVMSSNLYLVRIRVTKAALIGQRREMNSGRCCYDTTCFLWYQCSSFFEYLLPQI